MSQDSMASLAPSLRVFAETWNDDLVLLRQHQLLSESSFVQFCKDRGLSVTNEDPELFIRQGWVIPDATSERGEPLFHPFRFYTVAQILRACDLPIARSAT